MTAKFWVGGAGTWDNSTTTHWSLSTGGAGGAAVPTTGDAVTFDGSSGGGTVTADTTINNLSLLSLTMGAFTGTIDFSANNTNLTITGQFNCNGSGTRTLNMGSGTFTLSGANSSVLDFTTVTGLTLSAASAVITINGAPTIGGAVRQAVFPSGKTIGTVNLSNTGSAGAYTILSFGSTTITNLNITAPFMARLDGTPTLTVTNAFTWAGSSFSNAIALIAAPGANAPTITAASGSTLNWAALANITFAGTAVNATNSLDLKGNTMNGGAITGPSGTTVVGVIGS